METLFVGKKIIHLSSVDSTNNYTISLTRQSDIPEGLVVSADFQTNGRGQRNSQWWAGAAENLTVSVLLKPKFLKAENQFLLSMAVALAVKETVGAFITIPAAIKWPNDIVVLNKKIAGVLIENSLKGDLIEQSVIGLGLNVNGLVSEALPHAISFFEITNQVFDLKEVLEVFCGLLEAYYLKLKAFPQEIHAKYNAQVLGLGQQRRFADANGEFDAVMQKIGKDGRMEIQLLDGTTKHYRFKEISQLDIYL